MFTMVVKLQIIWGYAETLKMQMKIVKLKISWA